MKHLFFYEVYHNSGVLPSIVLTVIERMVDQPGIEMCLLCPLHSEMNINLETLSELDEIVQYRLRNNDYTPVAYT